MTFAEPVWQEGKAQFEVGSAFFRSTSRVARDLGVLAAAIYKAETGQLRVLEGMAGCGVRSLRYTLEANADFVWANDADPDLAATLQHNLTNQLALPRFKISHQDAQQQLLACAQQQDYYDLVDLDCFGNSAAYLSSCLGATRLGGLIYLTSTDGRSISGRDPAASLRLWGGYARSHPAAQEQGLRLQIGGLLQQAGRFGCGIQPLFSLFQGQTYRVMVRLVKHPWQPEQFGFLGYCHGCGEFQTVSWRQFHCVRCFSPSCRRSPILSGPLWLGQLHDPGFLSRMAAQAKTWDWQKCWALLQIMQAEASLPPYFYPLAEIGRRGKIDIPNRDRLLQALQNQGYRASATHTNPQAVKTDATLAECISLSRQLSQ
ncbi:MAG: tRNA (guanine-N1)-methyltransferase [Aphanocapsa sp. GSE-SYN-MK-11-07L]|jgi:tRNA (guanine26-N2/guanine27-N2)-dimethyltransferase|nr:tRNA (guanine-N1)-methyltransferase [Aphanocapsa sp. GSE-SYN-MK-11-07L]